MMNHKQELKALLTLSKQVSHQEQNKKRAAELLQSTLRQLEANTCRSEPIIREVKNGS